MENSNQLIVSECILVSNLDTSLNKADVEVFQIWLFASFISFSVFKEKHLYKFLHKTQEIFKRIGPVKNMILIHDSTGTFQGMAIVYFSKFKDAEKALEYDEVYVFCLYCYILSL